MKQLYYISNANTLRETVKVIGKLFNSKAINIIWGNGYDLGEESKIFFNDTLDTWHLMVIRLNTAGETMRLYTVYGGTYASEQIIQDHKRIKLFYSDLKFIKNLILD